MLLEDRIKQAKKFLNEDNYLKAFNEFSKLHCEFPRNEEILKTCMFLFTSILEAYHDFEPETAEEYIFRGVAKFYKGEYKESIIDFDKALSKNQKLDYAIKCKAFSLTFLGNFELAIDELNKAIALNPAGEYFDDLAENFSHLGDMGNALLYHEKAIKASPNDARLWYNFGTHLGVIGEFKRAINMFDEAIRLYPQYDDAKYNRKHYLNKLR